MMVQEFVYLYKNLFYYKFVIYISLKTRHRVFISNVYIDTLSFYYCSYSEGFSSFRFALIFRT